MCDFKTLHFNDKSGYVLQCMHCGEVTIGFGILTFKRSLPEFLRFIDDIHSCYEHYNVPEAIPEARNIPFWKLNERSCMTLSLLDLQQLGELVDLAYSGLILDQMLSGLNH